MNCNFYMNADILDGCLEQLYLEDYDENFVAFYDHILNQYPVALNLVGLASGCRKFLELAMIVFSGYKSDELAEFGKTVIKIKQQEIASGKWCSFGNDEERAADVIAHTAYHSLIEAGTPEDEPMHLYLVLGLYCYAIVVCNDEFDAYSFRRIFVRGWFIYYGIVLSVEHNSSN